MVVGKDPSLDDALTKGLLKADPDGFIPVKSYAVLWRPKTEVKGEDPRGKVYINNSHEAGKPKKPNQIPNHRIDPVTFKYLGSCDVPGCKDYHGWTSFIVESAQELMTILDILRNEPNIKFRPTDYAIKSDWRIIKPETGGASI